MSNTARSDERQLMSGEENSSSCCYRCNDNIHCTFDFFSLISVICLLFGFSLITIGYAIPRDYKFDPHKPARVMEAIENEYAHKRFALNVCIMVGTGFVTLSGLIISFIVTWELCTSENDAAETVEPERPGKPPSYGSVCGDSETGACSSGTGATPGNSAMGS